MLRISNGRVIVGNSIYNNAYVYVDGDKIFDITPKELPFDEDIDANGNYVSAGFIDIHVHGGGGYDVMDGGAEPIVKVAEFHATHGTTTILPTMTAAQADDIEVFLTDIRESMRLENIGCNIYGAHLEGPYLSKEQCGALDPNQMRPPIKEEYIPLVEKYKGVLKRWTFAPEHSGSDEFVKYLKTNNIVSSIGHSNGTYEDVEKSYNAGCNLMTHLYSAMSTVTRHMGFRKLGVIESAFLLDDMNVEVIADLRHLPKELLQMIYKIKGRDRICLVTDAMRGAGMPDGKSVLGSINGGLDCIVEDGVAKLTDRSAFAGSVATADRLVRSYVKEAGVDIASAVKMITETPAKCMNILNKGKLEKGMDADIVIFDDDINIKEVIVMGEITSHK